MSYLSDLREWQEQEARALRHQETTGCNMGLDCPASDTPILVNGVEFPHGHMVGCRRNQERLGLLPHNRALRAARKAAGESKP